MKTVIIIPAYNEEEYVADVIIACQNAGYDDVVVVNDGSIDDTLNAALNAGASVISHMINRGVGAATQTGLEAAKMTGADVAVTMDADGQHQASDIENLVKSLIDQKADIVIGSRFLKKDNPIPFVRIFFNNIANIITFLLSGIFVTDSQSGMKAFSKPALDKIMITSNGYEFCSEIIREARYFDFKVKEAPISVIYSDYSMSKGQNFASGLTTVFKLMLKTLMR